MADEAAGTVTINLTRPDAEFLYKLGAAACGDPAGRRADEGCRHRRRSPGTGAYMIASYDPNKRMKLVRNPHFKEWSEDAQPDGYPDEIDYDFGLTEEAAGHGRRKRPGRLDVRSSRRPTAWPRSAPSTRSRCIITPLTAMWYAPMNTRLAPFDNVKARQAVTYAIDRKALVNLFGGPVPGVAGLPGPAAGLPRA